MSAWEEDHGILHHVEANRAVEKILGYSEAEIYRLW
jgi:PAS domain-containing protein